MTLSNNALAGVTVVALEQAVAAPFATRQLADLGARVIKIERPGTGDFARHYDRTVHGESSYNLWLNRGKESVELDIKDPGHRLVLDALVTGADVLVSNLGPGALERLGLDAGTVRATHPGLVHCSLSGYGKRGPYRDKKAYDLLVQCEVGLLSVNGTADTPSKVGISIADIAAGMYIFSGVLAALYQRQRTGDGAALDIAMIDALGEWLVQPAYFTTYGHERPRRTGARHASIAPYGPYRCGDAHTVFVGIQTDREWRDFCVRVLGRPELIDDERFRDNPDRVAHNDLLAVIIEERFAAASADDIAALLDRYGIANAQMRGADELISHPQLTARDRWQTLDEPSGAIQTMLPPLAADGSQIQLKPAPRLGEHTAAILAEFGPPVPQQR
jgi:itaconate CoA-transferase